MCCSYVQCIRRAVAKGSSPLLSLVQKTSVQLDYTKEDFHMPSLPKREKSVKKGWLLLKGNDAVSR